MTEPSEAALKAAADALPITWGRRLVNDVAIAFDRFAAERLAQRDERIRRLEAALRAIVRSTDYGMPDGIEDSRPIMVEARAALDAANGERGE